MLIVSQSDVQEVLRAGGPSVLEDLVQRLAQAYQEVGRDRVLQHSRIYLRVPEEHLRRPHGLFSMSAAIPEMERMGTRLLALGGGGGEGLLVLFDMQSKKVLSILDDGVLHNYRTGAPAALATRYLAKADARSVAVIGSGRIARGTLAMVLHVLPSAQDVRVHSPTPGHAERFAEEMAPVVGRPVRSVPSAEEAVQGTDVIITATDADRPVVPHDAVSPGAHINVMARNEVEQRTFAGSRVFYGSRDAQRDLDPPWKEPVPEEWVDGELTDLVTGRVPGRQSNDETTVLVCSGPMAMWDVVAATVFYEGAERLGLGTRVSLR